jgi:hypothetical protein
MKCAIMSLEAKQAENGNWYVNILAQPEGDPFAEELKYRMWCSETLANKLAANAPETIELQKVRVEVTPYQKVSEDGSISENVFTSLSVVCRQFKGEYVDEPQAMADKLRRNLLRDGLIVDVDVDPYEGATGDLPN